MTLESELRNLFTEKYRTYESDWSRSGKKPHPKDLFWKFRPPFIDRMKDPYGAFHYTKNSVALLDRPLRIDEMVGLYSDLLKREQRDSNHDALEAERILLSMDIMEAVADRVKRAKYGGIVAKHLGHDINIHVGGVIYTEATYVYPSFDNRTVYAKGSVPVPNGVGTVESWVGPYKRRWLEVDVSDRRSGILFELGNAPTYLWWFDDFERAVRDAANKIKFLPSEQITRAQEVQIAYQKGEL